MRTRSIVLSLASLSLLGSCDFRVFDDLEDSLWVRADTEPSDSPSDGFGVGLIGTGGGDYQYFIASKSPPVIFMAKIDADGSRSLVGPASPQADGLAAAPFPTPVVLANDPSGFGDEGGNTAVGIFSDAQPMLYMMRSDGVVGPKLDLAGTVAPTGIAFGETNASPQVDLFAVAGAELNVVPNYTSRGSAAPSCDLGGTGLDVHVADVGDSSGAEVLVAVDGEIRVTTGSALDTASLASLDCFGVIPAAATILAPDDEASFGNSIRTGDFDGNGSADLAIAAPGENAVYVFLNWNTSNPSSGTKIATPSGATTFGTAVATGDFNGDGRDELVISDPGIDVDGLTSVGSVFIYEADAAGVFGEPLVLHDATPVSNQDFGRSLAIVEASGSARLVVGADNEVFTYFRTPVSGDDSFRN